MEKAYTSNKRCVGGGTLLRLMSHTARVLEQASALVQAGEVRTPLDALAILVHAMAVEYGVAQPAMPVRWRSSLDMHALTYDAIHLVVVRLAANTVVLASRTHSADAQSPCAVSECPTRDFVDHNNMYIPDRVDALVHMWERDLWDKVLRVSEVREATEVKRVHAPLYTRGDAPRPSYAPRLGDMDRDPLAASPAVPFGGPFQPPDLFPARGDGMWMGPQHPIFDRPRARYDPVSPLGAGEPDFDEFAPPHIL